MKLKLHTSPLCRFSQKASLLEVQAHVLLEQEGSGATCGGQEAHILEPEVPCCPPLGACVQSGVLEHTGECGVDLR
jgi:hypothetical protein